MVHERRIDRMRLAGSESTNSEHRVIARVAECKSALGTDGVEGSIKSKAVREEGRFTMHALFVVFTTILIIGALFLTGCAQKADSSSKEQRFIFVCPITENPYWQDCVSGIDEADAALGAETKVMGPSSADDFLEKMPAYMQRAIDEHPDGIIVYAGVPAVADLIEKADEEGIPVLAIDADAPDTARFAYVGTDLYSMGYSCGEDMVELTDGDAKVGYICTATSMENEAKVYSAFKDAISDFDIQVVAEAEGGNSSVKASEQTKQMLSTHPEIDAFFATGGDNGAGIAAALKELGRTDITLLALEDTDVNLGYLREGFIDMLVVQNPRQMGYQAVKTMLQYIDEERNVKSSVNTGIIEVTQENIDTYKN